jgi:hypothetical protein
MAASATAVGLAELALHAVEVEVPARKKHRGRVRSGPFFVGSHVILVRGIAGNLAKPPCKTPKSRPDSTTN